VYEAIDHSRERTMTSIYCSTMLNKCITSTISK